MMIENKNAYIFSLMIMHEPLHGLTFTSLSAAGFSYLFLLFYFIASISLSSIWLIITSVTRPGEPDFSLCCLEVVVEQCFECILFTQ